MDKNLIKDFLFETCETLKGVNKERSEVTEATIISNEHGFNIEVSMLLEIIDEIGVIISRSTKHFTLDFEKLVAFEQERQTNQEETVQDKESYDTIWNSHKDFLRGI